MHFNLANLTAWITAFIAYMIHTFGYAGIGLVIFAESGLLLGFILPGDSLIFSAGLLASQGFFNIYILTAIVFIAAVIGDNLGYLIGIKLGRRVFSQENSFLFNKNNLAKTESFFERHGKTTFIVQRFIPVIRAFGPLLGGVGRMDYRTFFLYDLIGCALWGVGVTIAGYFLGMTIPSIDQYILPIILAIVIISFIPALVTYKKKGGKTIS